MFQIAQNKRNLVEHRLVPTTHLVNLALNMQSIEPPHGCEAKALMQRPSARSPSVQTKSANDEYSSLSWRWAIVASSLPRAWKQISALTELKHWRWVGSLFLNCSALPFGEHVKQRDRPFRLQDFGHVTARVRVKYWQIH